MPVVVAEVQALYLYFYDFFSMASVSGMQPPTCPWFLFF